LVGLFVFICVSLKYGVYESSVKAELGQGNKQIFSIFRTALERVRLAFGATSFAFLR